MYFTTEEKTLNISQVIDVVYVFSSNPTSGYTVRLGVFNYREVESTSTDYSVSQIYVQEGTTDLVVK